MKDWDVRLENIQYTGEKTGRGYLNDIGLSVDFVYSSLAVRKIKQNINNWDDMELKSFCIVKESVIK